MHRRFSKIFYPILPTAICVFLMAGNLSCTNPNPSYKRVDTTPYAPGESRIIMPLTDHDLSQMAHRLRNVRLLITNGTRTLEPSDPMTIVAVDAKTKKPAFQLTMKQLAEMHLKTDCPQEAYLPEDTGNPVLMFCNKSFDPTQISHYVLLKEDGSQKIATTTVVIDILPGVFATHALWFQ